MTDVAQIHNLTKIYSTLTAGVSDLPADGIIYFDAKFTVIKATAGLQNLTGFQGFDSVNASVFALPFWTEKSYLSFVRALQHTADGEYRGKADFKAADDSRVFLELSAMAYPTPEFTGGTLVVKDVTRRILNAEIIKRNELTLQQREAELSKFIGMGEQLQNFLYVASHDLKEPLRIIGNFSQLLDRQCHGYIDDTGREYIKFITDGVRNMNALIDDLLHYSALDTRPHLTQDIHLPTMWFIIRRMQDKCLKKTGGELTIQGMEGYIHGDKTKFRLLLEALLSNAVKFKHPTRPLKILITRTETETHHRFSVKDNGIGIRREFFGKIFEMFKRLHNRKDYEGTGLGLALCKKITEQHGGAISVESVFGEGSTFTFTMRKQQHRAARI